MKNDARHNRAHEPRLNREYAFTSQQPAQTAPVLLRLPDVSAAAKAAPPALATDRDERQAVPESPAPLGVASHKGFGGSAPEFKINAPEPMPAPHTQSSRSGTGRAASIESFSTAGPPPAAPKSKPAEPVATSAYASDAVSRAVASKPEVTASSPKPATASAPSWSDRYGSQVAMVALLGAIAIAGVLAMRTPEPVHKIAQDPLADLIAEESTEVAEELQDGASASKTALKDDSTKASTEDRTGWENAILGLNEDGKTADQAVPEKSSATAAPADITPAPETHFAQANADAERAILGLDEPRTPKATGPVAENTNPELAAAPKQDPPSLTKTITTTDFPPTTVSVLPPSLPGETAGNRQPDATVPVNGPANEAAAEAAELMLNGPLAKQNQEDVGGLYANVNVPQLSPPAIAYPPTPDASVALLSPPKEAPALPSQVTQNLPPMTAETARLRTSFYLPVQNWMQYHPAAYQNPWPQQPPVPQNSVYPPGN